jgi:hypothetical protein
MARTVTEVGETYARLLDEEEKSRAKLARMREQMPGVREADEEAFAEAALADRAFPKRKEIGLRHNAENEEVALAGYTLAHRKLLEEACEAVGEGRRPLDARERMLLRRRVGLDEFLSPDERKQVWQGATISHTDPRPDELIEFVEDAYGWLDRGFEVAQEELRKRDGYRLAIAHVEEAKREHRRQGHMPETFTMQRYPNIVTEADYEFLDEQPGIEQYGRKDVWPLSIQDPANKGGAANPKEA